MLRNRNYLFWSLVMFLFVLILGLTTCKQVNEQDLELLVDFNKPSKEVKVFWNSTGFSPAEIVENPRMRAVLKDFGNLPRKGITYIRPHYLLNLVSVTHVDSEIPQYNWSKLDAVLDEIVANDLKLIFELMGSPYYTNEQEEDSEISFVFDNLEDMNQIFLWKRFVHDLGVHLESRYGKEIVRSWYFETTNEPDLKFFWKYDIPTFLNYYDASSEGLKAADSLLRFGGPGTANDTVPVFKALLKHCDTGTNLFTGEKGVRIDFISVHIKDDPFDMLERELVTMDYIKKRHPKYADIPFVNDETDPLAGWSRDFWWRRGAWYAAFVCQNIDIHQKILIDSAKVNYQIHSNDYAFLGGWHARTSHMLFEHESDSSQFKLVPKPVFSVMELVGLLGNRYVDVQIPEQYQKHFGVFATQHKNGSVMIMIYNKTSFDPNTHDARTDMPEITKEQEALMDSEMLDLALRIKGLSFEELSVITYKIDSKSTNPYGTWVDLGKPPYPNAQQYEKLLASSKPLGLPNQSFKNGQAEGEFVFELKVESPSVQFILLDPK
ncbi:GH39 family glycosyl hydrolase [Flagellimonas meridianipacifica]|uniref:L-iduronidase n=1 Tax=Flagellimonas meridianipacifica TaxID=1080225 RepID=A0A2T0M8D9_9FLAO|nr:hypothetical protein [Allomuricauda pacifica]PRX53806.1 L-iduronidase [Allomuricauda pacifica]